MMNRRRRSHYEEEAFSQTAIFITPMLDMAFQVLTFFVFTYHPTALEGQFSIGLATGEIGSTPPTTTPTSAASPKITEIQPTVTVIARARPNGRLASLELILGGQKEDIRGSAEREDEPIEHLLAELEDKLWQHKKANPAETRLLLQTSPNLRWGESMRLIDSCKHPAVLYTAYRDALVNRDKVAFPLLISRYLTEGSEYRSQFASTNLRDLKLFPQVELGELRSEGP
jgi:hypothetical protein